MPAPFINCVLTQYLLSEYYWIILIAYQMNVQHNIKAIKKHTNVQYMKMNWHSGTYKSAVHVSVYGSFWTKQGLRYPNLKFVG